MTSTQSRNEFNLLDYWHILLRRKGIVAIFSVAVVLTTAIATSQQEKAYLANTVVQIEMVAPRVIDWDQGEEARPRLIDFQPFYNTQYEIINSQSIKARTIEKLREQGFAEWDEAADPIAAFALGMSVDHIKDTRLIEIGYVHSDREKAATIANTIAEVYMEENLNRKLRATQVAQKWLDERTQGLKEQKRESELRLLYYMTDNDLIFMEERADMSRKNLQTGSAAYNDLRRERIIAETESRTLKELLAQGETESLISYFATPTLRNLQEKLNSTELEYASLSERYLPKYPLMLRLDKERKTLRERILGEVELELQGKEAVLLLYQNKEASLMTELERIKEEAEELEQKMVKYNELALETERDQKFFEELNQRQTEIRLMSLLKNSNIEVIDKAFPPVRPIRPNLVLNILLAILVSATGGVGLAFGVEYLDQTFKSPEEVEPYLGVPLLGIFPIVGKDDKDHSKRDTYVFHHPRSAVAECSRAIRTNLVLGNPGKELHSILVTSASPREGKSTLVVSLGITMASSNKRVLLADTDLRRPRLHRVFDLSLERGLTSLFSGDSTLEESVFDTGIPNLFILPAGPIPSNPAEILGSSQMKEVIGMLEERFDVIIFDSPPCIAVTDAVVLSANVDGVLLIIKQESTRRDAALEAKRRLTEVSDNLTGCIMNNIDVERGSYGYRYYYYYYHYYYGDYAPEDQTAEPAVAPK